MNSAVNSDKQYINSNFVPCTVNPCEVVHVQEKKKEKERKK